MKDQMDYTRYIDRYLEGVMSAEERAWFEKELEGNDLLREELQLQRSIGEVLEDQETIALKRQLDSIHEELKEKELRQVKPFKRLSRSLYLASGVAASAAIAVMVFNHSQKMSNEEILERYYQPADVNVSYRSAENGYNQQLAKAMDLYNQKSYDKAIVLFEQMIEEHGDKIGLNLYSGLSHMEIEEYDKANSRFKRIIDNDANPFIESANWYLGFCYLMTGEEEKAEAQFELIADGEGFYSLKAKKILKKID